MFSITYFPPYSNGATRTQYFNSRDEALKMIAFYQECGTRAYLD